MRLRRVIVIWYRSLQHLDIELGPFTVLFGKNNAGKSTILEAMHGIWSPDSVPGHYAGTTVERSIRGDYSSLPPSGALYAEMQPGHPFDDAVLAADDGSAVSLMGEPGTLELPRLAPRHVSFTGVDDKPGVLFSDPQRYFSRLNKDGEQQFVDVELMQNFDQALIDGSRPRPLFLDWEFADIDEQVTRQVRALLGEGRKTEPQWLEPSVSADGAWQVRPMVTHYVTTIAQLATAFLPSFLEGTVRAGFVVPTTWDQTPSVRVVFEERGTERIAHAVSDVGRGAARWIAAAIQIAVHVVKNAEAHDFSSAERGFSGHILFVDEPEAHLHVSAVASIVRWCRTMVSLGFNVVVASHHEQFLRVSGDDVKLVKVSREEPSMNTNAQTLLSSAVPLLQDLADDVGMHPATLLSLHRAALFVEGPLDEAVLDEFAGPALEAAGVVVIPIHGTKNLEGLVDGEFAARLGVKAGILADATTVTTMWDRANSKRSSEEKKLIKLVKRFEEQAQPVPTVFGVPEADLLFALPADAIRTHSCERFPGWQELISECRTSEGKGASDSVNWKAYAESEYGLSLTETGVRALVHTLDLAGVELPSIKQVVDEIIIWADKV